MVLGPASRVNYRPSHYTQDERIEELTYHIEEINDTVAQLKEEVEGKDAEIKTCRTQVRFATVLNFA